MARAKSPDRLGTGRIGALIFEFTLPSIISCIVGSLYNVVDTAILGYAVGDAGIAVATLGLPITIITLGASMLAGVGGNALAAIQLGEGKKEEVERTLGNTTILLVLFSLIFALVAILCIDPILMAIGTTPTLWAKTKVFVQVILIGSVFQSLGFGLNNFLRTAGLPRFSMFVSLFGTFMCLVLNVVLVIFLNFGVAGSAAATVAGQGCMAIPVLAYFIFSKNAQFKLRLSMMAPRPRLMGKITTLGLASFCMQVAATLVTMVLNQVVGHWGMLDPIGADAGLAAIGVASKVNWFGLMIIIGMTQGVQPLIGYNYGAKNWDRVIKTVKWSVIWCFGIGVVLWILLHAFNYQIVHIFGVSAGVEDFAASAVVLYSILIPFVCAQMMAGSYFQSSGQPGKSAFLELIRQVGFLIPLYLFAPNILSDVFGVSALTGVVLCSPVADVLACLVTFIMIGFEMKKLLKWRKEATAAQSSDIVRE